MTGVPHYLMSNLAETWMKYILRRNSICFYTTKIVRSWFPAFSWPCLADDIISVFLQWIQSNFNATRWSLSVNDPSRRSDFHLRSAVKLREKWFTSNIILPHGWLSLWRSCRCRWPSVGHQTNDSQWFRSRVSTLCLEGGLAEHFRPLLFAVTPAEQAGCFFSSVSLAFYQVIVQLYCFSIELTF